MRKFILISFLFAFALSVTAQATTPRFGTTSKTDNTGRVLTYKYVTPTYDDTITVVPNAFETIVKVAALTGNSDIFATETYSRVGDKVVFIFSASGGARTVTFRTGLTASATMVVDSAQVATVSFIYNGTNYVETGRAKE